MLSSGWWLKWVGMACREAQPRTWQAQAVTRSATTRDKFRKIFLLTHLAIYYSPDGCVCVRSHRTLRYSHDVVVHGGQKLSRLFTRSGII